MKYKKTPKPDDTAIPRLARVIPFGYRVHPDTDSWLQPVPSELEALVKALKYMDVSTPKSVADWLFAKTGRKIGPSTLRRIKEGAPGYVRGFDGTRRYSAPAT